MLNLWGVCWFDPGKIPTIPLHQAAHPRDVQRQCRGFVLRCFLRSRGIGCSFEV